MKVAKKKLKDVPEYCWHCGRAITGEEYILNLGSPGATYELCKPCIKALRDKAEKAIAE